VRENVIIAYRGTNYELGQWPQGYGLWTAGSAQSQPNEWWPPTPEGWSAAWYRFVAIEVPGTIVQVSQPATVPAGESAPAGQAGPADPPGLQPFILPGGQPYLASGGPAYAPPAHGYATVPQSQVPWGGAGQPGPSYPPGQGQAYPGPRRWQIAGSSWQNPLALGLLGLGIVLGVVGLFPSYVSGASLASDSVELVPHVIYVVTWAAAAVLIGLGGSRQRAGALLGLGVSAVTFGLFFADAGLPLAHGWHLAGAGLILALLGWLACAAGSWIALGRWPADWPRKLRAGDIVVPAVLIVAGLGAAIFFAPPWDRYVLSTASASQTVTEGNAFAEPGPVIVGNVIVMIAIVMVLVAAALWRPARLGWALAAGAIVALVAQLISALIQVGQPALGQLGITQSQASQAGLTATAGFTAWFWTFCVFVIALVIACGWLAARPERAAPVTAGPIYPGLPYPGPAAAGPAGHPDQASAVTPAVPLTPGVNTAGSPDKPSD
jgi:hypothetical protein